MIRMVLGCLVVWFLVAGVGVDLLGGVPGTVGSMASAFGSVVPAAAAPSAPAGSGDGLANVRAIACDAYEGGWPQGDIPTAVAITLPESNGNASAVQQDEPPPLTGWGLWQITPGDPSLLNPLANARAALGKFDSQGWGAWTTYTNGEYAQYLPTVDADLAGFDYSSCGG
jgi:hypothetical protein